MSTAEKLARSNLTLTYIWIALAFPSVLWWKDSILWVIVISLWANIVGHFAAYLAARAEVAQEKGHNLTELDKKWIAENIKNITTCPLHVSTPITNIAKRQLPPLF